MANGANPNNNPTCGKYVNVKGKFSVYTTNSIQLY